MSIDFSNKDDFDEFGRVHEGKGLGHDNPKLFNARLLLLLKTQNDPNFPAFSRICTRDIDATRIYENIDNYPIDLAIMGLNSRHSKAYREEHKERWNVMSHDERNGFGITSAISIDYGNELFFLMRYLNNFDNCYNDKHPKVKPSKLFKERPFYFIKTLIKYLKALQDNKHDQDGVDDNFPPEIVALRYWCRPRDKAFYKLLFKHANYDLTVLELIDYHLSWFFSLFFSYKKGERNSGTIMWGDKMIVLSKRKSSKFFRWVMRKRLGALWYYELCKAYYTNPYYPDREHIITRFAKLKEY